MRGVFYIALLTCAVYAAVVVVRQLSLPTQVFTSGWFVPERYEGPLVLFTGDVFLGRAVERWLTQDSEREVFLGLMPLLTSYPEVVINFEAAVPAVHQPTPDFGFQFSVTATLLEQLTETVTAASLANNHSFDFGVDGYRHTRQALQDVGITPFGEFRDTAEVYVTNTEPSIAIVAVNQVGTVVATTSLAAAVADAQTAASYVVVYVHWGEEYTTEISSAQSELARFLADSGVHVIVGHHPHVIQPIQWVDDTLVVYSLGNTVFDQYFSREVQQGLLVGLQSNTTGLALNVYPISSLSSPHQPQGLVGESATDVLRELAAMSDGELREYIIEGQIPLLSW